MYNEIREFINYKMIPVIAALGSLLQFPLSSVYFTQVSSSMILSVFFPTVSYSGISLLFGWLLFRPCLLADIGLWLIKLPLRVSLIVFQVVKQDRDATK